MPPILGIWASAFAKTAPDTGSYFPLGEFTLSGTQTTIEFTNIPQTYTHLQIRGLARSTRSQGGDYVGIRFNSDSTTNYNFHGLYADGSSVTANASTNASSINNPQVAAATAGSNTFGVFVTDILDYRNTNKFKTTRTLIGYDNNGSGVLSFYSGAWRSTSAITSITLITDVAFAANTTISLYGVLA